MEEFLQSTGLSPVTPERKVSDTAACEKYLAILSSYALRLCHHRWDAEDLVQETMLAALENAQTFTGDEHSFRSWLYTVLRNRFLSDCRYESVRRKWASDFAEQETYNGGDELIEAESVEEGLMELPAHQLRAVLMAMNDIPYALAAKIEGVPEGTMKSRVHLARRALLARVA